jgi:hypothetical protein
VSSAPEHRTIRRRLDCARRTLTTAANPVTHAALIRPDTLLMIGQFDHWATPFAKDLAAPSMNALMPMLLDLTDATGSSADLVKVSVQRLGSAA